MSTILTKILSKLKSLTQKNADLDKTSVRYLNRLAQKFAKAIDNRRGGVKLSDLGGDEEEETDYNEMDTNIRFDKKISEYPYSMQTVIKEYVDSVDESILKQAELQRQNKNTPFKRIKVCEVDSKFALLTDEYFNLDIAGFTVNINSNAFNHIERRHGIDGIADSSMANLNDVARIGYVIENRDSLDPLIVNGEQVYSAEFSTKEDSPVPMMLIKKRINGSYYCAIAVTDARYKKIWVQTAFINKKDGLTQILHDEISSLSLTSETVPASHPSINSIPDNSENVNNSDKNIK